MYTSIKIEPIWEDEDLFEVKVFASNGTFQGQACCYTTRPELARLGSALSSFPGRATDVFEFSTYGSENFSYFALTFFCTDSLGHVSVKVKLAEIRASSNTRRQEAVAEFEVPTEAAAIAIFAKALQHLAASELGSVSAKLQSAT